MNKNSVDTDFNVMTDTPVGRDPDRYSKTLRTFHKTLWNKPLPNGKQFELIEGDYLTYTDGIIDIPLSSDAITHSYRNTRRISSVIQNVPAQIVEELFDAGCRIAAYILFPSRQVNRLMNINQARGVHHQVADRFDLTLECIRLHYLKKDNPLGAALERYSHFFSLFDNFEGYVNFFLLNDLVEQDFKTVRFHLTFDDFNGPALPQTVEEYLKYRGRVISFIEARSKRIQEYCLLQG